MLGKRLTMIFDGLFKGVEFSIAFQVHQELGVWIGFGESDRFEKETQDPHTHTAHPGFECSASHVQSVVTFAQGGDLGE